MKKTLHIKGEEIDIYDYLAVTISKARYFCKTSIMLSKSIHSLDDIFVLEPALYLATHSAELYIKALVVSYKGQDGYDQLIKVRNHGLNEMHSVLTKSCPEAVSIAKSTRALDKFSGDKIRFAEFELKNKRMIDYGNSEILEIEQIQKFANKMLFRGNLLEEKERE